VTIYPRPIYILIRLGESTLSVVSRFCNAMFFGGSTYQSLSARAWVESSSSPKWAKRRDRIDWIFSKLFLQPDHCKTYYQAEVDAARKTLLKAGFTVSGGH
jgi:hypothetical protein